MRVIPVFFFSFVLSVVPLMGQIHQECDSVRVFFREGSFSLDHDFCDNGKRLESFSMRFRKLYSNEYCKLSEMCIISSSAPEGSTEQNQYLSEKRAHQIVSYIDRRFFPDPSLYNITMLGIDWVGLTSLVKTASFHIPDRDEILTILEHTPEWVVRNNRIVDSRQRQLMDLNEGEVWNLLEDQIFPKLRTTVLYVYFDREEPLQTALDVTSKARSECFETTAPVLTSKLRTPFYISMKTNMLYDLLLIPNIGAELYLGKQWSVAVNWMYAWWKKEKRHYFWRTYGGDFEVRRWFGSKSREKPLSGYHFGFYGQLLTYDFMLNKDNGFQGDRWTYGGGIACGYSHPVGQRLNIDFTAGIGYLTGEYKKYLFQDDGYQWQATKRHHHFGPTRAEISLVWLIDNNNHKTRRER